MISLPSVVVCAVVTAHPVAHEPHSRTLVVDYSRCPAGHFTFNHGCGTRITYGKHEESILLSGYVFAPGRRLEITVTLPNNSRPSLLVVDNLECHSTWTAE